MMACCPKRRMGPVSMVVVVPSRHAMCEVCTGSSARTCTYLNNCNADSII